MVTMRACQFRISFDLLGQPKAVQDGHVGVGQNEMNGLSALAGVLQRRERLKAIRGHAGLHAPGGKRLIQHPPIGRIVIHNQNRHAVQTSPARFASAVTPALARPNRAVKWKVLPLPGSLSTQIRPCIMATRRDEIVNPRPVPPNRRVVELSACAKASKMSCCLSARDADSGIPDREVEQRIMLARELSIRPAAALRLAP